MKKIGILIISLSFVFLLNGQNNVDIESIFKMQIFLDLKYVNGMNVTKNDSLYLFFSNNISLNIKKLKTEDIIDEFQFYSLNAQDDIRYNNSLFKYKANPPSFVFITSGFTSEFIICINSESGLSYRLFGFNGNDFFSFLSDYKERYNKISWGEETISNKRFLRECKVENLDFNCLYEALRAKDLNIRDIQKYPCLNRVNDLLYIQ